jgi:ferrous iron transport protein A
MLLADLPVGTQASVVELRAGGQNTALTDRLAELGFLHGEPIEVVQRGPGGREPLAVRVGETMFALRLVEARAVVVAPDRTPDPGAV